MSEVHPQNCAGDFYVEYGCCLCCDVPFTEAPGLFAYDDTKHCFVCRQPQSMAEFNGMIRAMWSSEAGCIRYRGENPDVQRRLAELGEVQLCDSPPLVQIQPLFRNHVTFDAADSKAASISIGELAIAFQIAQSTNTPHSSLKFKPVDVSPLRASISLAWFEDNFHDVDFFVVNRPECQWLIKHSPVEKGGSRGLSRMIDDWLKGDGRFRSVRWYSRESWESDGGGKKRRTKV